MNEKPLLSFVCFKTSIQKKKNYSHFVTETFIKMQQHGNLCVTITILYTC